MNWLVGQILPANFFGWASMLLQAVTWPAALIVISVMFRADVRQLLDRLVRLKIKDVEAQFQRELRESEDLASQVIEPRRLLGAHGESVRMIHELDGLVVPVSIPIAIPVLASSRRTPLASIEESWAELAFAADRAAGTTGTGIDPVRTLVEKGILGGSTLLLFERLRQLRMQVAQQAGWEPSADAAKRYADLARKLATKIEKEGFSLN